MDTSPNFAFLTQEFPQIAESASFVELHSINDPRAAMFHARHALERLIKRIYKIVFVGWISQTRIQHGSLVDALRLSTQRLNWLREPVIGI